MIVADTVESMRRQRGRCAGSVALVPTMGALHEGHLALIRRARELCDSVVVSIFVNPTQFAPQEDFDRYPRPIIADLAACEREGVSIVFNPTAEQLYPPGVPETIIEVPALGRQLEGEHRPGFFVGVCRVVAKLLAIVRPDVAVFGMKDYQQLCVIDAMAAGLCSGVRIEPVATVRESDGLAMSSRNAYLQGDARRHALGLDKALREAAALIEAGTLEPDAIEQAMRQTLLAHHLRVDYAVVRDAHTLAPVDVINASLTPIVCLIAARIAEVRLIDNRVIPAGPVGGRWSVTARA